MSQRLILPREWTQKTIAPIWKAAAISGWAFALVLAQCLVIVLAWPGRAPAPPPPPPLAAAPPAPAPPPSHDGLLVANSMVRIRCLLKVGRSQDALAEIVRCLSFCQRLQVDPPGELPELFATTVSSLSARPLALPANPRPNPPPPPRQDRSAPLVDELTPVVAGKLPTSAYPLAHPRAPRMTCNQPPPLAMVPEPVYPAAPLPDSAPYQYQPPFGPGMQPPGPPPYPGPPDP